MRVLLLLLLLCSSALAGIFNDNNGPITTSGNYLPILTPPPLATIDITGGSSAQLIKQVSWYFITDASAAGTITFQIWDANGIWRALPATGNMAPITLAASTVYYGTSSILGHGFRVVVVLSGGTIPYGELMGASNNQE